MEYILINFSRPIEFVVTDIKVKYTEYGILPLVTPIGPYDVVNHGTRNGKRTFTIFDYSWTVPSDKTAFSPFSVTRAYDGAVLYGYLRNKKQDVEPQNISRNGMEIDGSRVWINGTEIKNVFLLETQQNVHGPCKVTIGFYVDNIHAQTMSDAPNKAA